MDAYGVHGCAQVRELVRALRPLPGGGRDPNGMSPAAACHTLAGLVATSPDAKQLMMNETGALVLLELLDTDNPRVSVPECYVLMPRAYSPYHDESRKIDYALQFASA